MNEQHKATPEQWAMIESRPWGPNSSCILELRARVEALEATQQKIRSGPESPLVERVADAIAAQATSAGIVNDRPARAAIREVAKWLKGRQYSDHVVNTAWEAAAWLEQEAAR